MSHDRTLSRRSFLRVSAAAGGGMLLSFHLPAATAPAGNGPAAPPADEFAPNAFVRIAADGRVTVMINKSEMGQGVSTSLAMALAEELDADWSKVGFEFAPAAPEYQHPGYGIQFTGGSTSTMGMTEPMRKAGAMARALLVAAAAQQWQVPAGECTTTNGVVVHEGKGQRAEYGSLAAAAAKLQPPADVPLKKPEQFTLLGKPTHRLDTKAKVTGAAVFGIDVQVPGLLTALVAHPPTFGGKAKSIDMAAAKQVPGVRHVVDVGTGVAVVADTFWAAKRGRDALKVEWERGPGAAGTLATAALREEFRGLAGKPGLVARKEGDFAAAKAAAAKTLEADYELPFVAHSPMEPLNCTVDLRGDSCTIHVGTQFQTVDQQNAAKALGLPVEKVALRTTFLGGGFGRRANPDSDYVVEACRIAKAVQGPVKMIWTRDDDMRSGYYRPFVHGRIRGLLDDKGAITGLHHTVVVQSFMVGTLFESFTVKDGIDETSVEGSKDTSYSIPNLLVDLHSPKVPVPTQWLRSVGHSHTAFVVESFVDELAHAAGKDPLEVRRDLLGAKPRLRAVLDLAAERAGYGKPLPKGRAHGLAAHFSFETYVAVVLEVSIEEKWPRIHRATVAVDCGRTINPDTVKAQLEGALGFALGTALYSEIALRDGRVVQSNFHDYKLLRQKEMPFVDVHIVPSTEPSTGVGEPGVPPVAPALTNALFALTKKRLRRLPLKPEDFA